MKATVQNPQPLNSYDFQQMISKAGVYLSNNINGDEVHVISTGQGFKPLIVDAGSFRQLHPYDQSYMDRKYYKLEGPVTIVFQG